MVTGSNALMRARFPCVLVDQIQVERAGEGFVAELLDKLLHVPLRGDVVAPLAHPRGDDTAEVDAGAAVEDALVVGVLALERRLADLRDRDLLTVADDVALDQVRLLQALQSARGGLVRGVESVGDVRTRRLLPTLERAVEGQQFSVASSS